ncbi:MAG TPA: DUF819 family protein [Psychromonas hadalis]|nr:DUF819 family protein [Psychromonas hadalis]
MNVCSAVCLKAMSVLLRQQALSAQNKTSRKRISTAYYIFNAHQKLKAVFNLSMALLFCQKNQDWELLLTGKPATALIIAGSFFLQRFKFFKLIGPSILCIISGMIFANSGVMPHMHPVYITIITYAIPLSLSMFMLSMNLKSVFSLSKEPLLAVFFGLICVCTVAFLASFMFHDSIPNLYRYTGMFIATYTGGSANLAAVGVALGATPSEFAAANGADHIVGLPVLIFFFMVPSLIASSAIGKKIFPHTLNES